jgi:proline iminopeptidase
MQALVRRLASAVLLALAACAGEPARPPVVPPAAAGEPSAAPVSIAPGPRRITTSDGVELQVDVAGQGPPCIYVHGGPGQGTQSFRHLRGDRLESTLTMIYVDQRGSGQSASAADYRLDRVVADLDEVRAALGLDRVYLLAHSFGGVLAVRYAERYPARVRGLVLANATLWLTDTVRAQLAYIRAQLGEPADVPDVTDGARVRAEFDAARERLSRKSEYVPLLAADVATMRALRAVDADPPRNPGFAEHVRGPDGAELEADFTPRTAGITTPVLVITGDRDHAIGPDHARRFAFPRQTVRRIDGSHLLYYENSDAFVAVVRDWLTATPAP